MNISAVLKRDSLIMECSEEIWMEILMLKVIANIILATISAPKGLRGSLGFIFEIMFQHN